MNQPRGLLKLLKIDSLLHTLIDYVETRIDLMKAEAKDSLLKAIRAAAIYGAIAVLGFFFLIFFSITLGLVLNAVLNSSFWGFVIVTGIYLIALIVLFSLRNSEKVKNMIGDGSLAFLKADPKKAEKEDQQKEVEREKAVREKQAEIEHGSMRFDDRPSANGSASSNGQPADIKIEKKKDAN